MDLTDDELRELCIRHLPFDKWLPKEDLVLGNTYLCKARNFYVGKWNGKGFEYMRYKFGFRFPDVEYHWDDGPPYGTVKPLQTI